MNFLSSLSILVLLVIEGSMCAPTPYSNKSKILKLKDSMILSQSFSCNVPRQRSYYLADLMEHLFPDASKVVNFPTCVVVHRCDRRAGCCSSPHYTCAPVADHTYYDQVEVIVQNNEREQYRRWIQVEQHGKCSCMNMTGLPEEKLPVVKFIDNPVNTMKKH